MRLYGNSSLLLLRPLRSPRRIEEPVKLDQRISASRKSLQFYFSAKQEHSSRLKQRADFLRILLKNRLGGKGGEIGPNSELVGVINRRWLNELFPRTSGIIIDQRILA
eukprot:COSAG01_NODE_17513_length_1144_cov_1.935885_1_plen_108_part_00